MRLQVRDIGDLRINARSSYLVKGTETTRRVELGLAAAGLEIDILVSLMLSYASYAILPGVGGVL